jgi:hypothetical protein
MSFTVSGRAMPQLRQLIAGFPPRQPVFDPRSGHAAFVVDNMALERVVSEYLIILSSDVMYSDADSVVT